VKGTIADQMQKVQCGTSMAHAWMTVSLEQTGMLVLLKGDNMEEERQVDRYVLILFSL